MFSRIVNRIIKIFQYSRIKIEHSRNVYLTFDDGPDEVITEFVLNELKKYGFSATFFCCGSNAVQNPNLYKQIIDEGHAIGNHTFNHVISYEQTASDYMNDVDLANKTLHTHLFRPPCATISLVQWLRLRKQYKFFYWSINSFDYKEEEFDFNESIAALSKTKPGDIILFHFCHRHANETKRVLPWYLNWLKENGYKSQKISEELL